MSEENDKIKVVNSKAEPTSIFSLNTNLLQIKKINKNKNHENN
tara:strand:+ start:501 stop:629 length:129 start_codon:yes stop_codon:yes gene_type:complete